MGSLWGTSSRTSGVITNNALKLGLFVKPGEGAARPEGEQGWGGGGCGNPAGRARGGRKVRK